VIKYSKASDDSSKESFQQGKLGSLSSTCEMKFWSLEDLAALEIPGLNWFSKKLCNCYLRSRDFNLAEDGSWSRFLNFLMFKVWNSI